MDVNIFCDGEIEVNKREEGELDNKLDEVADDNRKGHDEPREIDLAKDICIGNEGVARLVEAVREILPAADSCKVEERLGHTVCRDFCDAAEHNHVHDRGHDWLDEEPKRPENRLLVHRHDVAPYEHGAQIPVPPQFLEVNGKKTCSRFDHQ